MLLKTKLNNMNSRSLLKMLAVSPAIIVTTSVLRALAMSLSLVCVLIISELIVSAFKKLIPTAYRDLIYALVCGFSASVVEILVNFVSPLAAKSLGVYLPILAVSCIVFMRIESCATESSVGVAFVDSFITGGAFTLIMLATAFVRELLGEGTLFAIQGGFEGITVFKSAPLPILQSTAGVLMMVAFGAAFAKFMRSQKIKRSEKEQETV